ncbi:DNA primase [Salmonella enterica subsp. enterica]|uniref:DNA primase n=1 Tax=Salmonella enterica I TaxID=59201 RepID=A0A3S4JAL0_SALET|nr:DNA primase [Salmonella enterica subsp. enterica]
MLRPGGKRVNPRRLRKSATGVSKRSQHYGSLKNDVYKRGIWLDESHAYSLMTCWRETDIVDLIDVRVKLKKQGKNYHACCPFHNEKTPSFTVNGEKQFYHCFGCGAHGNAIDFLMNYDKLEFVETVEELAAMHNLEIPYEAGTGLSQIERHQRQNLYQLMNGLNDFYQQSLTHPAAKPARDYLQKRGLSAEIIQRFAIGFAPPGWDNALKRFGNNSDNKALLLDAGMLVNNEQGSTYDRFRNRVMFPIRDKRGRVIGFGGRVLGNDTPKYLNSPETDIFP